MSSSASSSVMRSAAHKTVHNEQVSSKKRQFRTMANNATSNLATSKASIASVTSSKETLPNIKKQKVDDMSKTAILSTTSKSDEPKKLKQQLPGQNEAAVVNVKKKKKRPSPFRVKVGCVVALRYRAGGNHVSAAYGKPLQSTSSFEEYVEVWTDPLPGRDEGLALIGKRVRCCFANAIKRNSETTAAKGTSKTSSAAKNSKTTSIIEGEIISILDYGTQLSVIRQHQQRRRAKEQHELVVGNITVELLVDIDKMRAVPFLKRTDEVVDVTKLSESAKRSYKNEEAVRGVNKAIVTVILAGASSHLADNTSLSALSPSRSNENDNYPLVSKWAIRKRVLTKRRNAIKRKSEEINESAIPVKDDNQKNTSKKSNSAKYEKNGKSENSKQQLSDGAAKENEAQKLPASKKRRNDQADNAVKVVIAGASSSTKYVGDKNDDETQQIKNWRWVAGRQNDISLFLDHQSICDRYTELLSNSFIGEVMSVEPTPSASAESRQQQRQSPKTKIQSLAMVSLRRLVLPECTASGRLSHHGPFDIFDDLDATSIQAINSDDANDKNGTTSTENNIGEEVTSSDIALTGNKRTTQRPLFYQTCFEVFQVPIEELVIVCRRFHRRTLDFSSSDTHVFHQHHQQHSSNENQLEISLAYSLRTDQFLPLSFVEIKSTADNKNSSIVSNGSNKPSEGKPQQSTLTGADFSTLGCKYPFCHHCRVQMPLSDLIKCTSSSCCAASMNWRIGTPTDYWWCRSCLGAFQQSAYLEKESKTHKSQTKNSKNNDQKAKEEKLPCCLGCCDCRTCQLFADIERCDDNFCSAIKNAEEKVRKKKSSTSKLHTAQQNSTDYGSDNSEVLPSSCNQSRESSPNGNDDLVFSSTNTLLRLMDNVDFNLPGCSIFAGMNSLLPLPSGKLITQSKRAQQRSLIATVASAIKKGRKPNNATTAKRGGSGKKNSTPSKANRGSGRAASENINGATESCNQNFDALLKDTGCRLLPYSKLKELGVRSGRGSGMHIASTETTSGNAKDKPRNLRAIVNYTSAAPSTFELQDDNNKKSTSSRALRASQRRFMKDVAAIGKVAASSLGLDALVGREQQLRFDRSGIHAWGVFADANIGANEMIVEYKGELIGNAMAEKREKEYELAKIGSDYMFRIDALTVCDATKQGNVARFINASCDPNCYTKIITLDGTKRIAIYAKRDIQVGEELCYDYKFAFEFEESKRIPCYCGARDCRGYMNWDKRYVALPSTALKSNASRKGSSNSAQLNRNN